MNVQKTGSPKTFTHTLENHRRAMRALVDKLINNNFDFTRIQDEHIYFNFEGTYCPCGNKFLDLANCEGDYALFSDFEYPWLRFNYAQFNHLVAVADINQEIVDYYRDVIEVFDDPEIYKNNGYPSIELIDDPKVECAWAMRTLADNLIKADFDPTVFRTYPFYPFSLITIPRENVFSIRVSLRKNRLRFHAKVA